MAKVKEKSAESQTEEKQADDKQKKSNKKEKKVKIEDGTGKRKKKGGKVVILLIFFVLIIGVTASILFFNAFNIREKYLRTTIDKIPIVKNIIPKPAIETLSQESTAMTDKEAQAKIAELENQLAAKDTTINTLTSDNDALRLENNRLKEIESQQIQFKSDKEAFDKMIAENDPAAYSAFYEEISPENAQNLYQSTKATAEKTKELKKYTDTFATIEADAGAKIIEEMVGTDMNLASLILKNIDSEQRAQILAAMDATKAASVVKYMAPTP